MFGSLLDTQFLEYTNFDISCLSLLFSLLEINVAYDVNWMNASPLLPFKGTYKPLVFFFIILFPIELICLFNNSLGKKTFSYSLSGNKGLCGVPSLPQCSLLWENGRLSTGGKIGIGLSCLVIVSVLVLGYIICIRRRRNDYDFAPPHDLMCKYFSRMFNF
jgi:hypothetical protein